VVDEIADKIAGLSPGRLRVAVDGLTGAGKTTLGHELAAALRRRGRPTARASMDDFKHPWRHAREHGYDRTSGEGYYRNAYDFLSARELLLRPAGADASGEVVLCAFDPLTGEDHRGVCISMAPNAVLIVDTVFAFRPEFDEFWDFRIWLDVDSALALQRGVERDKDREGLEEAERVHRDRYHAAEQIYVEEVNPQEKADVIVDNSDFARPVVAKWPDRRQARQ
jgi:uridine kinase